MLALGFGAMILGGGLLLHLPLASAKGEPVPWLDAFFIATSATTVTGLAVVEVGKTFSLFGQLVILALIQVGGLGFMVVSTLVALLTGRRIFLRERLLMQEALGQSTTAGVVRLTQLVLKVTLLFEGTALLLLTCRWAGEFGWGEAFYLALFHSISAFCNAGFSLFSTSLVAYRGDLLVNLVITALIIAGGLGFIVLADLYQHRRWHKFSLHTKMVLTLTAFLVASMFLFILVLEIYNPRTLAPLPWGERILGAYFQAVVPRTAGFNTLDIGSLFPATGFLIIALMFIGASPGGTGGGIKTTTFGTLAAVAYSLLTGKEDIEVYRRRLPRGTILKAIAVSIFSFSLVFGGTLVLLLTERFSLLQILFEVTSAFGTVGLSTGITPSLSPIGRVVVMIVMYTGRLGPLTVAFALAPRVYNPPPRHYPEERIIIG